MAEFDTDRDPLDVLAEEFAERCRRGEAPSVTEYIQRYPEWAERLCELLPPVAHLEQLKRLKQSSGDGGAARPEQLGDYRIVREVGRGGMGIVYEAVQQSLARRVALKVLPAASLLDPKKLERFRREAQAAANLHHTNIVPVFGVGEQGGLHYYVMQFIDGQGLDRVLAGWRSSKIEDGGLRIEDGGSRIEDGGSGIGDGAPTQDAATAVPGDGLGARSSILDPRSSILHPPSSILHPPSPERWRQVARMGAEAAEALHYAHEQGTLHRDVKPANLLLDRQGTLWVTDFGLAKLADRDGITSAGDVLGTLQYMAPEGLEGRADARSDVYGLGLTLHELLTLEPPYRGSEAGLLLGLVRRGEPVPPRKLNPSIPRDLETVVLKAVARDPAHRYATAGEMAEDLRRFLDDRPVRARRATTVERLRRWCRRNPLVAGLVAALVVVFLAGFAGVFWKWREAEAEGRRAEDNLRHAEGEGRRAEENLRRAAANEKLSLQALEEIFDHYAQRNAGPYFPPKGGKGLGPQPKFESEDDAVLLETILKFYDQFARQNAADAKLRREAARAYRRVGDIQRRLGRHDKSEAAYRRAAAMLEELAGDSTSTHKSRLEWAETATLPEVWAAVAKDGARAEDRLRKALAVAEEPDDAPRSGRDTVAARAQRSLGTLLQQRGRAKEAEAAYREAVRIRAALARESPPPPFAEAELGHARLALAEFLLERERPSEARDVVRESIADLERGREGGPGAWFRHRLLTEQYQALAVALTRNGETAAAASASREAERLGKQSPPKGGPRPGKDKRP